MFGTLLQLDADAAIENATEKAKAAVFGRLYGDTAATTTIEFPDELAEIDHSVTFTAFETKQALRLDAPKGEEKASISLPIPANLQTAYNISYTETSLGALGREFMDALGGDKTAQNFLAGQGKAAAVAAVAGAGGGALTGGNIISSALTAAAVGMTAKAIDSLTNDGDSTAIQVGASALIGTDQLAAAAASQFGIARNPHKIVLFESVGFRKHSFSYQFTPKNRGESIKLRELIKLFKFYASPGLGSKNEGGATGTIGFSQINGLLGTKFNDIELSGGKHFFKYPEYFKIKFRHPEFLFEIGNSFLTSVDVNYQPAGAPTYARDSHQQEPAPTQVNLGLTFTETDIVTKANIMQGR